MVIEPETSNLTSEEEIALEELQNLHSIIIKPADKGSTIVIMNKDDYCFEVMRQLQDQEFYRPLQEPIYLETQNDIIRILKQLHTTKHINQKQLLFLIGTKPPRPRYFYLLPKIHKETKDWTVPNRIPKGRPIISDCGSESYGSAQLINHYLNPLATKHPSYIKDTNDFLEKVTTHTVTEDSLLFTMDVESLFTNIETSMGLEAIRECFFENPDHLDDSILELLQINLERNDFIFDSKWFLQTKGMAMGKRFSPAYANIYMAKWEKECFQKSNQLPEAYYRYLDDIWGIWNHSWEDLERFTTILNNHHPSIKVKLTWDRKQIIFLDTVIFKGENFLKTGKLDSKIYFKTTDSHQFLHKHSFHPKHTFTGILKAQLTRFNRICSNTTDRDQATQTLFQALRKKKYPRSLLQKIKKEVFQPKDTNTNKHTNLHTIPLIGPFSQFTLKSHRIIRNNVEQLQKELPHTQNWRII